MSLDWQLVGYAWGACALAMLAGWIWQSGKDKTAVVDVIWAFLTGIAGVRFALSSDAAYEPRSYLLACLIALWSLRLGIHLAKRFAAEGEDGRYAAMKNALGSKTRVFLFFFFQMQAGWAILFALPILAATAASRSSIDVFDALGLCIFLVAWTGESIADKQLDRFRNKAANKGKVCNIGLWRYSRHPNYFFEWLHWFAYPLIGWGSPAWLLTAAGPLVMFVFLYRVTGIPYTEMQALRSRGDAYREYQRSTSAFFPLPPKDTQGTTS